MKPVKFTTFLFTMLVGLIFQLYPWSDTGVIIRPDFLLVIMIYWVLQAPYHCNIGWVGSHRQAISPVRQLATSKQFEQ